jgi:apolipoprotein N-acyltransferase
VVRVATPQLGPLVKVGLIASDAQGNRDIASAGTDTERLFREYAAEAEKAALQGARVLVIPEKLGVVVDPETRTTDTFFSGLADKTGAVIVAGMVRATAQRGATGRELYNEARVYAPGRAPLSYDKEHMLPPFESQLKPGTTLTTMEETSGTWGVEICKDMDFTPLSREYGVLGTGLLLVPAWDFGVDRTLHGHMALMRGVESGFSMARAAKLGFLTVSDNRGRVLAERRSDAGGRFTTLVAEVPVEHARTMYLRFGDWFAWVMVAVLAGCLGRLSFKRAV